MICIFENRRRHKQSRQEFSATTELDQDKQSKQRGMNARHQQFINEYIACHFNATAAYKRVYPGTTDDAARAHGARLVAIGNISEEIQRRIDENAMSANEVLARLAEHGRSDIADFVNDNGFGEISISLVNAEGELRPNTRLIKKITQHRTRRTVKDMTTDEISLTLEMHDAQAALVQLGRHHGVFDKDKEGSEIIIPIMMVQPGLLAKLKP